MPLAEIRQRLERSFGLEPAAMRGSGPARYFRVGDSPLVVGFITPLSQHFCDSCNRVRLSADGRLHLCLGEEEDLDLRTPLRTGASRDQLAALIAEALQRKPMRHQLNETPERILRPMSALGG
jgi:cyclic pyranopterin phosphate synthase